ncbi:unnamed protein product, partial [Prorocentrum cordatum]
MVPPSPAAGSAEGSWEGGGSEEPRAACEEEEEREDAGERAGLLSPDQSALLGELAQLAGAVAAGDRAGAPCDFDSFYLSRRAAQARCVPQPKALAIAGWAWVAQFRGACEDACEELSGALRQLDQMEGQRRAAMDKVSALCGQGLASAVELERLSVHANRVSQRLARADCAADIAAALDQGAELLASLPDFSSVLDQLESSAAFVEAHHEFCDAKAGLQQLDHLRNRSCILVRSAVQRSLERAEAQVQQHIQELLHDDEGASVPVQVFYAPFHAAAPGCRSLAGLLLKRAHVHPTYAAALAELEAFYGGLRIRLVGDSAASHVQALLSGQGGAARGQLAAAVRQAAAYVLDACGREHQCFHSFFEPRRPQEALDAVLRRLSSSCHEALQQAVEACGSLDVLREAADCLLAEFLEPHQASAQRDGAGASGGAFVQPVAALQALHARVQKQLVAQARISLAEAMGGGYRAMGRDLRRRPADSSAAGPGGPRGSRLEALDQVLGVLAKVHRALDGPAFEELAWEAVTSSVAALKEASADIARADGEGEPPDPQGEPGVAARAMDAQLFLIRHLLVLREQVAAFEYGSVACGRGAPGRGPPCPATPCGQVERLLRIGSSPASLRRSMSGRNRLVEEEICGACGALVEGLCARICLPLAAATARLAEQEPGPDAGGEARASADSFLENVRTWVPLAAARFRAGLGEPGGEEPDAAGALLEPVRERLAASWEQLREAARRGPAAEALPAAEELERTLAGLLGGAPRGAAAGG